MTIKVSKITSPDLFKDNESIIFHRSHSSTSQDDQPKLAAISFVARKNQVHDTLGELAAACVHEACIKCSELENLGYNYYLFLSDNCWQSPTSRVMHLNLLVNFRQVIGELPSNSLGEVVSTRSIEGVRFATILPIMIPIGELVVETCRTCDSCFLLISKRESVCNGSSILYTFEQAFPVRAGLAQKQVDWMTLSLGMCPAGDVLFRIYGMFDDIQASVDVIGIASIISIL